jgi:hypothetical protein
LYLCRRLLTSFRFTIEHCVHLLLMLKVIGKHIYAPLHFSSHCQRLCVLLPLLGVRMSSLYRGPSINAFYQVSVHLAKQFQRRWVFFLNRPIRNKNCLWWPCLLLGTCTRREYNFISQSQINAGNYRYSNTIQLFLKLTHYLLIVDVE